MERLDYLAPMAELLEPLDERGHRLSAVVNIDLRDGTALCHRAKLGDGFPAGMFPEWRDDLKLRRHVVKVSGVRLNLGERPTLSLQELREWAAKIGSENDG